MADVLRILSNFASAFFLASGFWCDLLLLRIFLSCAYACLVALAFVSDTQNYENYMWNFVNLYIHGSSAVRLMLEERPIKFDDDRELLWRYLYRHSGISRLLFKRHIAKRFELKAVEKGTVLNTNKYFYIILDGAVVIDSTIGGGQRSKQSLLLSGEPFDLKHLSPARHAFLEQELKAIVAADSKIFCCSEENMKAICSRRELKDLSMGLLIATLSDIASQPFRKDVPKWDEESRTMEKVTMERSPLFSPLEESEQPACYLAGAGSNCCDFVRHILFTLKCSFVLPWPFMWVPGLRQVGSLPVPAIGEHEPVSNDGIGSNAAGDDFLGGAAEPLLSSE